MIITICICGAGTMGRGIAQETAQSDFNVILFDISVSAIDKAKVIIEKNLKYLVDKEKISSAEKI
jgi:3-hydroxybutyryl-CoA dehydrogenase